MLSFDKEVNSADEQFPFDWKTGYYLTRVIRLLCKACDANRRKEEAEKEIVELKGKLNWKMAKLKSLRKLFLFSAACFISNFDFSQPVND
jgi:hypothetical protein